MVHRISACKRAFVLHFKATGGYWPATMNNRTPVATTINTANGPGWDSWTVHAQQHYSFLHHLERGDLRRYKFPLRVNPSGTVSHDFVCMWGADVDMIKAPRRWILSSMAKDWSRVMTVRPVRRVSTQRTSSSGIVHVLKK